MLAGRQMLLEELSLSKDELDRLKRQGDISLVKGVIKKSSRYVCQRCGNSEQRLFAAFLCKRCNEMCTYCRKCITMGRVGECTVLVRDIKAAKWGCVPNPLRWEGQLSPGQGKAARGVVEAVRRKESFFIWAVCGAGKTEMLFYGIEEALKKGERVCIATPRTDVVLELAPRLRTVFPDVPIAALYGGSLDREKEARLIVSTTHQLLRYYKTFDVMIVDEIDAFPYAMDKMLHYAVEQASKDHAAQIYLTATPAEAWKRKLWRGKQKGVIIPGRYHRHPLPVPRFQWCGDWKKALKRKGIPPVVLKWLKYHLLKQSPIFLFVPHVRYIDEVSTLLKPLDNRIEGVYAEDSKRKEKVAAFRNGNIPLLVTTTILERGVTVENLQVAVLGAEEVVFSESALVQIAGRAGRSHRKPDGDIFYFHYGKTEAMIRAKKHIQSMNKRAKQEGLID
ncbi:DEAD/DEAH box helicase [Bacillus sp. Xin]|uniref:DEAD/DEAH box helicase n=1 Tax=unclassified Bacillus (in: firmicutes) TaxID=185979 RepID=UPI0015716CAC|nr:MULTISPECIES: DEAD/DEAH box helicase [unclassified Bacillus (in: firmicutes)]MBC6975190.1 DEAD/DEAH box helicase [Bacillus sp. Xin]NSW36804.1 DEAD/DEAH box helicase [Bacillus sp. Xin1]